MNIHKLHAQISNDRHKEVHSAIERAVHQLGYASLKKEQLKVVVAIKEGPVTLVFQCYQPGMERACALRVCLQCLTSYK